MKEKMVVKSKYLFMYALTLFLPILIGIIHAQDPGECDFQGTISGKPVQSVSCEILTTGSSPYLFISAESAGYRWMMDVSGITKKSNPADISFNVMQFRDSKMQNRYSSRTGAEVKPMKKKSGVRYFDGDFTLTGKGGSLKIKGRFSWNIQGFPPESVR